VEEATAIRLTAVVTGTPIGTLVITVTGSGVTTPLIYNLSVINGVAAGTIKIPPGPSRTITVTAMDDQGNVTHDGSITRDIHPGQNPPIELRLTPHAGQVPITVTFGNYGVVVTPATATIDATASRTAQLTVAVTDVNGQGISSPAVGWATSNPAVATVSAAGLVTGVANGTATIVATYEGVAGLTGITVGGFLGPSTGALYPACLLPAERQLADIINAGREHRGLSPLPVDTRLVRAARGNAALVQHSASGLEYFYPVAAYGGIGAGFRTAAEYWDANVADPAHATSVANYYSATVTHIGVGFVAMPYGPFTPGWADLAGFGAGPAVLDGPCDP
jgi:uncharacterized protein YkwD